jgi:16S rRNA G966 N2-methylase RsmD
VSRFKKFSNPEVRFNNEEYEFATHEIIAEYLAKRLKTNTIADLCCSIGSNAIQFARFSDKVVVVDISRERLEKARNNARLYNVDKKIEFILGDVLDDSLLKRIRADIVFIDPDWSKDGNCEVHVTDINNTIPPVTEIFQKIKSNITGNIAIKLSKEMNMESVRKLGSCEIEYIKLNNTLKFVVAYFGNLKKVEGVTNINIE